MITFFTITLAFSLDHLLGEPRRFHPLVGFGFIANKIEHSLNISHQKNSLQRLMGIIGLISLVLPLLIFSLYFSTLSWVFDLIILTLCIGWRSLREHGLAVYQALQNNDNALAKQNTRLIVSRDVEAMNQNEISKACVESMLENGNDAIFAAVFWFLIAGPAGVISYRVVNTLDAMWGYKNSRFKHFGWAAARLDDLMNYIPARLTALSYFVVSRNFLAIHCWRNQGNQWKSPNAGPVMAAGAGSLKVILGGTAMYDGVEQYRPTLGSGEAATPAHIKSSLTLILHSIFLWLFIIFFFAVLSQYDLIPMTDRFSY